MLKAVSEVRDHIPLEQGLRLQRYLSIHARARVRDHIPLEQGLRLSILHLSVKPLILSETIFH